MVPAKKISKWFRFDAVNDSYVMRQIAVCMVVNSGVTSGEYDRIDVEDSGG